MIVETLSVGAGAIALWKLKNRLMLSFAKHPSLRGHARMARRVAPLMPYYAYDEAQFYRSDDAPEEIATRRKLGLERLAREYRERFPKSLALTHEAEEHISDLQFTSHYRVPFQYRDVLRKQLEVGAFVASSSGVRVRDQRSGQSKFFSFFSALT